MNQRLLTTADCEEIEFQLEFYLDTRCKTIANNGVYAEIAIYRQGGQEILSHIITIQFNMDTRSVSLFQVHEIHDGLGSRIKILKALRKASALL